MFEILAEPNRRDIEPAGFLATVGGGDLETTMDTQRRLYRLKPEPLQEADAWLAKFLQFWSAHVDALERQRHRDRMDRSKRTERKTRRRRRGPNRERDQSE